MTTRTGRSGAELVLRGLLVVGVAVALLPGAALALFFGTVTWTGCFLSCTPVTAGQQVQGALLVALAAGLVSLVPLTAGLVLHWRWAVRSSPWVFAALFPLLLLAVTR